jgi:hypothetical protein
MEPQNPACMDATTGTAGSASPGDNSTAAREMRSSAAIRIFWALHSVAWFRPPRTEILRCSYIIQIPNSCQVQKSAKVMPFSRPGPTFRTANRTDLTDWSHPRHPRWLRLISLVSPRWQSARLRSRKARSESKRIAFLKLRRPLKLRPALSSRGTWGEMNPDHAVGCGEAVREL